MSEEQEIREGDHVRITAAGVVERVYENGDCLVRVHGEVIPMTKNEIKHLSSLVPPPPQIDDRLISHK